jgi:hypothetical protein
MSIVLAALDTSGARCFQCPPPVRHCDFVLGMKDPDRATRRKSALHQLARGQLQAPPCDPRDPELPRRDFVA